MPGFDEDSRDLAAIYETVVRPLDADLRAHVRFERTRQCDGRPGGEPGPEREREFRAEQKREPEAPVRGRLPFAPEATAAGGLALGENGEPTRGPTFSGLGSDVVGRAGFLKDQDF